MVNVGKVGEELVCKHLAAKGWLILERNYRTPFGEVDVVARDCEGTLVFVEVKTMRATAKGLSPEDNLTRSKLVKMRRMADFYANKNPQLVHRAGWRIDAVAVVLTKNCDCVSIRTYENL